MDDLGPRVPDPRMIPAWQSTPSQHRAPDGPAGSAALEPDSTSDEPLIRPFLLTQGRTRPLRSDLRLETLVLADPAALYAPLEFESKAIVRMCQNAVSVAEVAVWLAAPLGVARVLIADLIAAGHLRVPQQRTVAVDLLERIRDCVRAL